MTEYRVDPMKADDYVEALTGLVEVADLWELGTTLLRYGPAYTARIDGRIAAVAGVYFREPHVGKAWAVWTDVGRGTFGARRFVHRAVLHTLRQIVAERRPLRLEADVNEGHRAGEVWAQALGMRREGEVRRYAGFQGRHLIPYVWLAEEACRG